MSQKGYWIYAFRDDRYESGVKIGIASNRSSRFQFSQGYTPGDIECLGTWIFHADKRAIMDVEKSILKGLPGFERPNNGTEWIDIDTKTAADRVSDFLSRKSDDDFKANIVKNDVIHTNVPTIARKGRAVLWIFKEAETDRLKVTCLCDWTTPLEIRRTYSRNGFTPVAAILNNREISQAANDRLYETKGGAIERFSDGNPMNHNWLEPGISVEDVTESIINCDEDLVALEKAIFKRENRPKCVAKSYQNSIDLADPEFAPLRNEPVFL